MQKIAIANELDQEIGSEIKEDAIAKGLIRRIARIIISNPKGEIFIQKRKGNTRLSAGKWDQSAGGHVAPGESYEQAAYRELQEELGITGIKLVKIAKFYYEVRHNEIISKSFNELYTGIYSGKIVIDPEELQDGKWISVKNLQQELKIHPEYYTSAMFKTLEEYGKWQKQNKNHTSS